MRWRPFLLSALAVTALLALAASAAGTRPLRVAGTSSASLPSSLYDYTFTILVILGAVTFIAVARFVPLLIGGRTSRRSFQERVLRSIGAIAVVSALLAVIFRHLHRGHVAIIGKHSAGGTTTGSWDVSSWWVVLLAASGLGLLLALLALAPRRRAPGHHAIRPAETLAEAISESIDDLLIDSDLRRAIVAAYSRMERALAASGLPRDPAEAPNEYLERALLSVDASAGAVRRLTELFERAKFSHHEPDARMRDDAIDALVAVRDDLWAAREVAA